MTSNFIVFLLLPLLIAFGFSRNSGFFWATFFNFDFTRSFPTIFVIPLEFSAVASYIPESRRTASVTRSECESPSSSNRYLSVSSVICFLFLNHFTLAGESDKTWAVNLRTCVSYPITFGA